MRKTVQILCLTAVALQTGVLGRQLLQSPLGLPILPDESLTLPLLPPGAAPAQALTVTPAPGPSATSTCALQYLQTSGNFKILMDLVDAASEGSLIAQILESDQVSATLLAPTDTGIMQTIQSLGLTLGQIQTDPLLITELLTYHILPSPIQDIALVDGYAFNTELTSAGKVTSVSIKGTGLSASFVAAKSSAPVAGPPVTTCQISIIPLNGLLVPY